MGDRVEAAGIEAGVLRIADPAVEAVVDIVAAVAAALEAEEVVVRAGEAAALRIRLRHAVAVAEGLTGKVVRTSSSRAHPFTGCGFVV